MVQDGGKKKKNKNKNKKKQQQNEATSQPEAEQQTSVPLEVVAEPVKQHAPKPVTNNHVNAVTNTNNVNKNELILKNLAAEASQWMNYNWSAIQEAESKYQIYLASQRKACKVAAPEKKDDDELDLFASDDEPEVKPALVKPTKPAKAPKKAPKQEQPQTKAAEIVVQKVAPTTYLSDKNDEKTLVLLKPDAVHRNLMGDIIAIFEERGFKLAALKFMQATEDMLKEHYGDLAKKPFFPELVRYMMSGPIVAMVWTGLNIVPMVRTMVGATRPCDAAPGSIRGDFCIDVGRNLIHASDSSEAAQKEVSMWFTQEEICQWRPVSLEWIYEDEVAPEDSKIPEVDKAEAMAGTGGAASAEVLKKLKDLELENKDLKQVTKDLKAMVLKLEGRVAALEKNKPAAAAAAPAPAKAAAPADDDDDDDVDLFGSDEEEEEEDAAAAKIREERLAAYAAKKATKKAVIAKTSVCLDIKPWDDETDMNEMLKQVKTIEKDGLIWGASKLVPVGYGINKLRIVMVVEDEKVSIDEVQEQIAEFEDFVQSVDVESMQKI